MMFNSNDLLNTLRTGKVTEEDLYDQFTRVLNEASKRYAEEQEARARKKKELAEAKAKQEQLTKERNEAAELLAQHINKFIEVYYPRVETKANAENINDFFNGKVKMVVKGTEDNLGRFLREFGLL